MIKTVIIDFDDTLYNYTEADNYACDCVFEYMKERWLEELKDINVKKLYVDIVSIIKKSNNNNNKHNKPIYFKKMFENLYLPIQELYKVLEIYEESFNTKMEIFPNVISLLCFLKKNNYKIALLSNNHFHIQYQKLQRLNLLSYFDYITTTDEIGEEKPMESAFLHILHYFKTTPSSTIMIGDNYKDDILPSIRIGMLPFYYDKFHNKTSLEKDVNGYYYKFNNFQNLIECINHIFIDCIDDLIHLSLYFSQSLLSVQGTGGNISVKSNNTILIKSSGTHLGNINKENICLLDVKTNELITRGTMKPSMESAFHCILDKKYIVHLHFIPTNQYLCTSLDINKYLQNFKIPYIIIPYVHPGIELSDKIKEKQKPEVEIYFLKNHGIILCVSEIERLYKLFQYVFYYFNKNEKDWLPYELYHIQNSRQRYFFNVEKTFVCDCKYEDLKEMIYCFPDLAVYFQNILYINEDEKQTLTKYNLTKYDLLIYVSSSRRDSDPSYNIFIITNNINQYYYRREILQTYCILQKELNKEENEGKLISIKDKETLVNLPTEIYRKNIIN